MRRWVQERPEIALSELCQHYQANFDQRVGTSAMDRAGQRLGPTRKKKTLFEPRRQSERVQALGAKYREAVAVYAPAQRIDLD